VAITLIVDMSTWLTRSSSTTSLNTVSAMDTMSNTVVARCRQTTVRSAWL
jgi:hypothetical protein